MLDYRSLLETQLQQNKVAAAEIERYLRTYDGLLAVSRKCTPKEAYDTMIGEYNFHLKSQEDRERVRKAHSMGV